ncbi:hypothetical protein, partial [Mesorhizobium sp.]|uniref:hypothetical protein n=1 Tax=Mesorhizobium sp. TaxID=1871066 RepID=UPI0025EE6299
GTTQHSAYGSRHATIVYPWHPFFGMTVQISHNRRGKKLKTIHTDIKPGYSREVPNWMLDPSFCAGMNKGLPEVSIESLNELAMLLTSLSKTQKRRASSSSSNPKERRRAEKKMCRSSAAQAGIQQSDAAVPGREGCEGIGGSTGGPHHGGDGPAIARDPDSKGRL